MTHDRARRSAPQPPQSAERPLPAAVQEPAAQLQRSLGNRIVGRIARAAAGIQGPDAPYPHLARIQAAFGRHALGEIRAHVDPGAQTAARDLRARAYTLGSHVAFAEPQPSLRLAAHEAAHVVQQAAGVRLSDGVGHPGDPHEVHADRVAAAVVRGGDAEAELDRTPTGGGAVAPTALQLEGDEPARAPHPSGFIVALELSLTKMPTGTGYSDYVAALERLQQEYRDLEDERCFDLLSAVLRTYRALFHAEPTPVEDALSETDRAYLAQLAAHDKHVDRIQALKKEQETMKTKVEGTSSLRFRDTKAKLAETEAELEQEAGEGVRLGERMQRNFTFKSLPGLLEQNAFRVVAKYPEADQIFNELVAKYCRDEKVVLSKTIARGAANHLGRRIIEYYEGLRGAHYEFR